MPVAVDAVRRLRLLLRVPIDSVGGLADAEFLTTLFHGVREILEHALGVGPADTCVGDGDAVLQAGFAFGGDFLGSWREGEVGLVVCCGLVGWLVRWRIYSMEGGEAYGLTFVDVTLDHHAHDSFFAVLQLLCNHSGDFWLIPVVFEGIAVATIHHHAFR